MAWRPQSAAWTAPKDLALFPLTDELEDDRVTCYPARPGYASNIHKLQGAKLSHVTIWLDVRRFKADGYLAMSRVKCDTDYILAGFWSQSTSRQPIEERQGEKWLGPAKFVSFRAPVPSFSACPCPGEPKLCPKPRK